MLRCSNDALSVRPAAPHADREVEGADANLGFARGSIENLAWKGLTRRGRTFEFNRELHIRVLEEDGGWAYESDDPELMGFGLTRPDAEQSFCVDFAACWDEIACQDDGKLTKGAIELKRKLLALVKAQR